MQYWSKLSTIIRHAPTCYSAMTCGKVGRRESAATCSSPRVPPQCMWRRMGQDWCKLPPRRMSACARCIPVKLELLGACRHVGACLGATSPSRSAQLLAHGSAAVGGSGCLRGGGCVAKMLLPLLLLLTRFKRLCVLVCRYTHRLLKVSVMRLDREAVCVVCCVLCVLICS